MQLISAAMLGGCLLFLSVPAFMRFTTEDPRGLAIASYVALALGLLSPVLAIAVDRMLAARPPDPSSKVDPVFQRHLVTYAILDFAALSCGLLSVLAPDVLPLVGAAVPVGAMVLRFPRAS
jgi:hypothetical protein